MPLPQPVWYECVLNPTPTPILTPTPTLTLSRYECVRIKRLADSKRRGVDYERDVHRGWAMLEEGPDGTPRFPKVQP